MMTFKNPFREPSSPISPQNNPQKLSLLYIEQAYFHRIQIKSLPSLYKLNVKIKKPIILSLHTLPVLKYIIEHTELINAILQMENIYEIRVCVPGYGIFNQKYELETVSGLFVIFGKYCQNVAVTVKKIVLEFPGWRAFTTQVVGNIFSFVEKCDAIEEFTMNLNHIMDMTNSYSEGVESSQKQEEESDNDEQTFYGLNLFQVQEFDNLMKCISGQLPSGTLTKLQLRFGAWQCVNSQVVQILINSLQKIYQKFKNLKTVKLDLHGWATGKYSKPSQEIPPQLIDTLFKIIQQFDGQTFELLEIDMRHWPSKYKVSRYRERFLHLCGGKRKDQLGGSQHVWNMTGTNFMGSQFKSKIMGTMKVEIKD